MEKIQKVFFDIDDTLFSTSDFARQARLNSIDALIEVGVDMDRDELFDELREVINEFSSNYPYHYDKLLLRIPDEAHEGINDAIAVASAVIAYHKTKGEQLEPFPDARRFLDDLRTSTISEQPGVITEGLAVKQAEKLLRLRLYKYFDPEALFISEQVGISKPNPKLFERALRETGAEPSQTLFVGDKPSSDMDPANEVGMHTVHLDKDTRHSNRSGETEPDYRIENYRSLVDILRNEFQVEFPDD